MVVGFDRLKIFASSFLVFTSFCCHATDYYWKAQVWPGQTDPGPLPSAEAACQASYANFVANNKNITAYVELTRPYKPPYPDPAYAPNNEAHFMCEIVGYSQGSSTNNAGGPYPIPRYGDSCPAGDVYNVALGQCENATDFLPRKQLGLPRDPLGGPTTCEGNPVNSATGNKFEDEADYVGPGAFPLRFTRYYNGETGLWSTSYSAHVDAGTLGAALTFSDGRQSVFLLISGALKSEATELGSLSKLASGWLYVSANNEQLSFDARGRLVKWTSAEGLSQTATYGAMDSTGNTPTTISDASGNSLTYTVDNLGRLIRLAAGNLLVTYQYEWSAHLVSVTYTWPGKSVIRKYLYEDGTNASWLTGIIDERGVRYATWHYDAQGRAISSEHANGAEKVTLTYNDDGSTTVTNALGHAVTYRYQVIQGIKHITSIEGETAAGCPASNSSYTYNAIGQVATKTDALGHITAYTYDTLGRETQRVEAQGTPQARTTTTTWHGSSFLLETVTTSDRVTTYTYDDKNRLLSTNMATRNAGNP
jgi:YD repeat-containing protein